jgi:hypothetical protein
MLLNKQSNELLELFFYVVNKQLVVNRVAFNTLEVDYCLILFGLFHFQL